MGVYSIKQLELLSGIKAHTIRIWEQRYGILNPERTDTNIRWYNDEELKLLLNISTLIEHGYKISKIAKFNSQEISKTCLSCLQQGTSKNNFEDSINQLIISMIELNEQKFHEIFIHCEQKHGFKNTMLKIIYPLLYKIGILWGVNEINPAQEHFITNLIREKLIVAIHELKKTKLSTNDSVYLLFLKESEFHEIGLLFCYYLLLEHNKKVFYLGQHVPLEDILKVKESVYPSHIFTLFINPVTEDDLNNFITGLSKGYSKSEIIISGTSTILNKIQKPSKNIKILKGLDEFIQSLEKN